MHVCIDVKIGCGHTCAKLVQLQSYLNNPCFNLALTFNQHVTTFFRINGFKLYFKLETIFIQLCIHTYKFLIIHLYTTGKTAIEWQVYMTLIHMCNFLTPKLAVVPACNLRRFSLVSHWLLQKEKIPVDQKKR